MIFYQLWLTEYDLYFETPSRYFWLEITFIETSEGVFLCKNIHLVPEERVRRFSQRCSKIFYKTNKMQVFAKINEKSRTGINGYFYNKNHLLWEWHLF